MVDEQKLRQLAEAASLTTKRLVDMSQEEFHAADNLRREFKKAANPAAILSLLDELQTLREERTAWRVTAENAEKDAARYRWLRKTTNFVTSHGERIDVRGQPELWDASIDAAILEANGDSHE